MAEITEVCEAISDLIVHQATLAKGLGGLIPAETANGIAALCGALYELQPSVADE